MRKLVVIGLSCFLMSCAMGPDYERPKTELVETFRMAEAPPDAPSIANMAWWDLLQDEQLQALIKIALVENKDLQQAVATVEEFQARAFIARSDFLPGLTASGNAPAFGRKTDLPFSGVCQPLQLLSPRQSGVGARYLGAHSSIERSGARRSPLERRKSTGGQSCSWSAGWRRVISICSSSMRSSTSPSGRCNRGRNRFVLPRPGLSRA